MLVCGLAPNKEHLCGTFAVVSSFVIRLNSDSFRPNAIPAQLNHFICVHNTQVCAPVVLRVSFSVHPYRQGKSIIDACHYTQLLLFLSIVYMTTILQKTHNNPK